MNKAFKKIAIEAALKAGRHIKKNIGKVKNIRYKGEINVVTEPESKPATPVKETKIEVRKTIWVTATAYSSTPWQTDNTPCVTATGYNVCDKTENIIAVSRDLVRSLGYHRQVRLPSLYGSEIFLIEDTMNARFVNRIDIHHGSTEDAKEFGLKRNVELQVI